MKYGSTGDQVDRLRIVFARGEVADVGFEPWPEYDSEPADFKELVVRKLQMIYRNSESRLAKIAPCCRRNRAGYALARAASSSGIHLGRLLAGSEGTLGVTLQAVLRTRPIPACRWRRPACLCRAARRRGVRRADARSWPRCCFVRSVRPPLAEPGTRGRCLVPRLDRRIGRSRLDGGIRGRRRGLDRRASASHQGDRGADRDCSSPSR